MIQGKYSSIYFPKVELKKVTSHEPNIIIIIIIMQVMKTTSVGI
jgi:hypothetical protein